jgi:hypothetical protein
MYSCTCPLQPIQNVLSDAVNITVPTRGLQLMSTSSTVDRVAFAVQSMDFEVFAEVYYADPYKTP